MSELIELQGAPICGRLDEERPAAVLRGTARGLELVVWAGAPVADVVATVTARLSEAPGFFRGSDVLVRVEEGPLVAGCLARLDELARQFELRITEVSPVRSKRLAAGTMDPQNAADAIPTSGFALGSAPAAVPQVELVEASMTSEELKLFTPEVIIDPADEPTVLAAPVFPAPEANDAAALARALAFVQEEPAPEQFPLGTQTTVVVPDVIEASEKTRVVVGPVRSGVILEHRGHLIIFGDVNPGAEVRAEGNIVVLGRLRGTAHAGIGATVGFILALRLEPQQLRIGRMVARAGEGDAGATDAEIAYVTDASIVVERYQGRLPRSLAASI